MTAHNPLTAFLAAKATLEAAPGPGGARARAWAALCGAAEGVGLEAAYQLYARACQDLQTWPPGTCPTDAAERISHGRLHVLSALARRPPPAADAARYWRDARLPRRGRRVFVVSDLHIDKAGSRHMEWVRAVSPTAFLADVLIVAGDVADSPAGVRAALAALRPKFGRVAFVPGNHDLWLMGSRGGGSSSRGSGGTGCADSFTRMFELRQLCCDLGVDTAPFLAGDGLVVAPLLSWYDAAFDTRDPRPGKLRFDRFCQWPVRDTVVWQVMLRLNTPHLRPPPPPSPDSGGSSRVGSDPTSPPLVITASHFLPHPALPCSPFVPELRKAVGCAALLGQLAALGSSCHVYGHTHINASAALDDGCGAVVLSHSAVVTPATAAAMTDRGSCEDGSHSMQRREASPEGGAAGGGRRYVQYALEAAFDDISVTRRGATGLPGLACVFDGQRLTQSLVLADIATGKLDGS